jgi:hypothetical protein
MRRRLVGMKDREEKHPIVEEEVVDLAITLEKQCPDCGYIVRPACAECKRRWDRNVSNQAQRGTLNDHLTEHYLTFESYGEIRIGRSANGG